MITMRQRELASVAALLGAAALLMVALAAGCSDGSRRRGSTPTSPTGGATTASTETDRSTPGSGSRNVATAVEFAPRNETFAFRQQLESTYRDQLRRSPVSSFVDIEGTIVWTQEYLRYRVNGCGHQDALDRVQSQISGQGIAPVCADFAGTIVQFPPRNEPFAFRQELERIYRDQLRRGTVQTFVDPEGDIVWTQEYVRYRVNLCSHAEASSRTIAQVMGGPVQPTCATVPGVPPVTDFVTGVSGGGATATLQRGRRPDAAAGPAVTSISGSGSQVTVVASQLIDRVVVTVDTNVSGSTRNRTAAVADSYYELRLPSPTATVTLNIQLRAAGSDSFTLEIAVALGDGPLGPYGAQAVTTTSVPTTIPLTTSIPLTTTSPTTTIPTTTPTTVPTTVPTTSPTTVPTTIPTSVPTTIPTTTPTTIPTTTTTIPPTTISTTTTSIAVSTATFTYSPDPCLATVKGLFCTFDGSASKAGTGTIIGYIWEYLQTSTETSSPTHTPEFDCRIGTTQQVTIPVTLRVRDSSKMVSAPFTRNVTVRREGVCGF
jgi:hypothetical protein